MNQLQIFMPPPANWQDFQNLVVDIAKVKYVESTVQEYGRQGQIQKGIDVFAQDLMDNNIGIQCKETKKPSISKSTTENKRTVINFLNYFMSVLFLTFFK